MPENLFLVGEFSRLTHLTAKTLRHYHEVDLLVPAVIHPSTGYRYYTPAQIPRAQLIRRLRDVRMPVPRIREVLTAPDEAGREAVIGRHLDQLQRELAETAAAVGSLRAMLTATGPALSVTYRPGTAEHVLASTSEPGSVTHEGIGQWFADVFPHLFLTAHHLGARPTGAGGALYTGDWFTSEGSPVTAVLPVGPATGPAAGPATNGTQATDHHRVHTRLLESPPYAVAVHEGPYSDIDRTYGALGEYVHRSGLAADGPIRENYLISPAETTDPAALRTEVCWPITHVPA